MLVQETRTTEQTSEDLRIAVLQKMQILDTPPEAAFDALAQAAEAACDSPFGAITLVDEKRQWFKAPAGLDICEVEREHSFCTHTIRSHEALSVEDACLDPRFAANPLVTGPPGIRAYLGAPIVCEGQSIGAVCVTDFEPRAWSQAQIEAVQRLALIAGSMIALRAGQRVAENGEARLASLMEGEARQRRIFEAISEGVILQDAAGRVIDFNPSAARILGLNQSDFIGRTSFDMKWRVTDEMGEDLAVDQRPTSLALHEGRTVEGYIMRMEKPVEGTRWLQVNASPLFADGPDAPATHVAATFADVTALKNGERIIRASERRLRDLFQSLPAPVYTTDAEGYLTFYNEAAAAFWGQRPTLGVNRWSGAYRLFAEDGAELRLDECPMAACLQQARPVRDVIAIAERPDGSRAFFQPYPTPLFDADGALTGAVNMLVDVTHLKDVENGQIALIGELETAKEAIGVALQAAQAGSRAKSAFLANMSHELRTPLNGVIGMVDALANTAMDGRQREMLGLVADSARSLEHILSDILDLSKIEAERLSLELDVVDLGEVLGSACELMRARADEKGLGFDVTIGPGVRTLYRADGLRLRQVVSNLVSNAIKFTKHGHVRVSVDCAPDLLDDGATMVRIDVADTGAGFDQAAADRLFERFEQADTSITRQYGGTGLGLPISRELVRLMGGELTAVSKPEGGRTFSVTVPLHRAEAPTLVIQEPPEPVQACASADKADGRPLRILVAEDHPTNRRVVQLMLEPTGGLLTFAENGQEAVEAFSSAEFDVILMDMQMPVMDGLTAIREIRALEAHQPGRARAAVAMLSANVGEEHYAAATAAGADGYIVKPVTIAALIGGMTEACERSKAAQAAAPMARAG